MGEKFKERIEKGVPGKGFRFELNLHPKIITWLSKNMNDHAHGLDSTIWTHVCEYPDAVLDWTRY